MEDRIQRSSKFRIEIIVGHNIAEICRLREDGLAIENKYEWFADVGVVDAEFVCAALNAAHERERGSKP